MVSSSLSGCSKDTESKAEPTKVEINQDLVDAIRSGKEFDLNEDGSITYRDDSYDRILTVDELKKCGMEFELVTDNSMVFGDVLIYKVNNIDLKKVPNNILFEGLEKNYKKVDNIDFDTNVTWDDCIKEIEKKNIDEKYKKILVNAVEKYKTLGLEKGLPMFYSNIVNSEFVMDPSHPSAMFQHKAHKLVIGCADIKDDKANLEAMQILKEMGYLTDEDIELSLTQEEYIMSHEPGHMISVCYDEKTKQTIDIDNIYAVVEKGTNNILTITEVGKFLGEGFADYLTYEVLNRQPTKIYGYSINQSVYLSIKEMLNINSIEELRTLDTDKFIKKLKEMGFEYTFDWAFIFEQIVNGDLSALYTPENGVSEVDYTEVLQRFFLDYYNAQINNGVSNKEIGEVFNNIIETIRERVAITNKDGSLVVEGIFGYTTMCTSCLEDLANYLTSQKTKSLK